MTELLIAILVVILAPAVMIFLGLVGHFKFPALPKAGPNRSAELAVQFNPTALNCRVHPVRSKSDSSSATGRVGTSNGVQLTRQKKGSPAFDAFSVEICGSIHTPGDMHYTTLQVFITDVTDDIGKAKPVHSRIKQWQIKDSPVFVYNADLGKLPNAETALSDWTAVAQLNLDWLMFPRKGKRELQFSTSILSGESGAELACATCIFTYENPAFGYIDLEENIQRAKTLAVALAFTVSAADNRLYNCEVELIKDWARGNIGFSRASNKVRRKLNKALDQAVAFFRDGNQIDTYETCREIVEIAPVAERYDILDLCLRVVQANGTATVEELALLRDLANWLEVDTDRFRAMMEKILPVGMHEVEDVEVVLGVTSDMSKEKTREHLNKEYRKWNARVTNPDPEIQSQADHMLKFIAEARSQYIG